ncbi:hypothetical protein ABW22_13060 [Thiobacillus denitrificans]|uniref:Uncharacterized protein n=1 Tax=Thiobacillus denitrificans TaxID=36861 RepID=A0A125BC39_THIDE|nr:hypothetical protein ABW22_13060 [Thiobacillus denitrificans]
MTSEFCETLGAVSYQTLNQGTNSIVIYASSAGCVDRVNLAFRDCGGTQANLHGWRRQALRVSFVVASTTHAKLFAAFVDSYQLKIIIVHSVLSLGVEECA